MPGQALNSTVIARSMLDTDLYKLTMQQAVLHHFPHTQSKYRFTLRDKSLYFTRQCAEQFQAAVAQFADLSITDSELKWLQATCSFLKPSYIQYLSTFRFKPSQVQVKYTPVSADGEHGNLDIEASGPWVEAILWEVPLMACLSELYFRVVSTDWSNVGQYEAAYHKAHTLLQAGCAFSDFGTRRRRSFAVQDLVIQAIVSASRDVPGKGALLGTSNVHLARKYDIKPVGTMAHEWFMGVAALKGYEHANTKALDMWEEVYPDEDLFALTDTFTTECFFKNINSDRGRFHRWTGFRQDSGDPFAFATRAKELYQSLGIDPREKTILFSDSLNSDKAIQLKKHCSALGLRVSFGIGTSFTNDFHTTSSGRTEKSKPLNMVIKLSSVDGKPCVKLSDDSGKNTGDPAAVQMAKEILGLT